MNCVRATRIWLHRAEGPHAQCFAITFEEDVWAQASKQLIAWSVSAPIDGSVHKTDFKVTYADGAEYSGTFGLTGDDVRLGAHMRGHLRFLLAHPEVYGRYVDLVEARMFLEEYEIGS